MRHQYECLGSILNCHHRFHILNYFRKIGKGIFINQARVIRSLPLMTEDGKSQYLYLIGECFWVLSLFSIFRSQILFWSLWCQMTLITRSMKILDLDIFSTTLKISGNFIINKSLPSNSINISSVLETTQQKGLSNE